MTKLGYWDRRQNLMVLPPCSLMQIAEHTILTKSFSFSSCIFLTMSMLVRVGFYIRSYIYLFEYVRKHPLTMSEYASQGKILHSTETSCAIMNATFHKEISVAKFQVGISRYLFHGIRSHSQLEQLPGTGNQNVYIKPRSLRIYDHVRIVCICVPCWLCM